MLSKFDSVKDAAEYLAEALRDAAPEGSVEVTYHPGGAENPEGSVSTTVEMENLVSILEEYCSDFSSAVVVYEWNGWNFPIGAIECCCEPSDQDVSSGEYGEKGCPMVSVVLCPDFNMLSKEERRATLRYFHRRVRESQLRGDLCHCRN